MIYGYARVSTKGQARNGNSLDDQTTKLAQAGCEKVFCDAFSGTKMDRPQFSELLNVIQPGDTLVVTKLDRFARTASEGATTVRDLVAMGVEVNVLNMGRADNTPMGKLMVQIMFAFAEFERDMIVERTTSGKAVARANDPEWKEGRRKKSVDNILELKAKVDSGLVTIDQCCEDLGISRRTWYNRLKEVS